MCQAAELFFAGEIVKESDEAGVKLRRRSPLF